MTDCREIADSIDSRRLGSGESDEEYLQHDLKGRDGITRVVTEGFHQMIERAAGGIVRERCGSLFAIAFGWWAAGRQFDANGGLCFLKSSPDPIGRRFAHAAVEFCKGLAFVAACGGCVEKIPELLGTEKESFDFVGDPDAEGASTSGGLISIVTEDASGSGGFVAEVVFVVASQGTMAIQRSDFSAVGALSEFKVPQELGPF